MPTSSRLAEPESIVDSFSSTGGIDVFIGGPPCQAFSGAEAVSRGQLAPHDLGNAAQALFSRHVDLTPLRSRRRGTVRCLFHEDRTASLSLDLDRGLFNCFGCGVGGGLRRFAELVGEASPSPRSGGRETALDAARRDVLIEGRRARAFGEEFYRPNAAIRDTRRRAQELRAQGHANVDWDRLFEAAALERATHLLELALDERC